MKIQLWHLLMLVFSFSCSAAPRTAKPAYSPGLQEIIAEATSGTHLPIRVETVAPDLDAQEAYQGQTTYKSHEIVMRVLGGISKDYDEALLGHEYFHVILHNRGFVNQTAVLKSYQLPNLRPEDSAVVLSDVQTVLGSCFLDALIDRETSKHGLKPALLNERQATGTLRAMTQTSAGLALRTEAILQKAEALTLFCLAIRKGGFSMEALNKAAEKLSPEIVREEQQLVKSFGKVECQLKEPKVCYDYTLQLRDAAGLHGIVFMAPEVEGGK